MDEREELRVCKGKADLKRAWRTTRNGSSSTDRLELDDDPEEESSVLRLVLMRVTSEFRG